ncbi:carbon storage regulator [Pararhodobacter sp.]|uniref:carbon storage regulator n=1 Tax=Pararhodobacter sp. TaxID=2127056 RepID=UPI003FA78549
MLAVSVKEGGRIAIGDDVIVTVRRRGGRVCLCIDAPETVRIRNLDSERPKLAADTISSG